MYKIKSIFLHRRYRNEHITRPPVCTEMLQTTCDKTFRLCNICLYVEYLRSTQYKSDTFPQNQSKSVGREIEREGESKHAESRARYERDTSHVICLPHIRQNLTALISRLCEKLQSHLRGCFGVGHPKRLGNKNTMKEACRVPASIASWPLGDIHPSRRHRPK